MSDLIADFLIDDHIDHEPAPDIAKCSKCGWKGRVSECDLDSEGNWESGYYDVHLCPTCDDGGCIDDYDYSDEQALKFQEFNQKHTPKK